MENPPAIEEVDDTLRENDEQPNLREIIGRLAMRKYIDRMVQQIRSRMYSKLNAKQFEMIGDLSCNSTISSLTYRRLHHFDDTTSSSLCATLPLFSPDSTAVFILHLCDMIIYIILGSYLTTSISFLVGYSWDGQVEPETLKLDSSTRILINLYIVIQFIQTVISLNMIVFEQGKETRTRRRILIVCLQSVLFYSRILTAISLSTLILTSHDNDDIEDTFKLSCLLIVFLVHFLSVLTTIKKLEEKALQHNKMKAFMQMIVLFCWAFLIAHIAALVWIIIGVTETQDDVGESWIQRFLQLQHQRDIVKDKLNVYSASLHYIIVTMVTVGYGDIYPTTPRERLVNILIMITCSSVFAYVVSSVGQILQEVYQKQRLVEHKIIRINGYMKKKSISTELQQSIRQYLFYVKLKDGPTLLVPQLFSDFQIQLWTSSRQREAEDAGEIVNELSDELRVTLMREASQLVLRDSEILRKNFSKQLLNKTAEIIKELKLCPYENICTRGQVDSPDLYFVLEGSVEVYLNEESQLKQKQQRLPLNMSSGNLLSQQYISGHSLLQRQMTNYQANRQSTSSGDSFRVGVIKKGECFGVCEFFTGQERGFSIRSGSESCTLLGVPRSEFLILLKEFTTDYERFCDIRDQIALQLDTTSANVACLSCRQMSHYIDQCPFLHYVPDSLRIIQKNNQSGESQVRSNNLVKGRGTSATDFSKSNTLHHVGKVKEQYCRFFMENETILLDYYHSNIDNENDEMFSTMNNTENPYNNFIRESSIKLDNNEGPPTNHPDSQQQIFPQSYSDSPMDAAAQDSVVYRSSKKSKNNFSQAQIEHFSGSIPSSASQQVGFSVIAKQLMSSVVESNDNNNWSDCNSQFRKVRALIGANMINDDQIQSQKRFNLVSSLPIFGGGNSQGSSSQQQQQQQQPLRGAFQQNIPSLVALRSSKRRSLDGGVSPITRQITRKSSQKQMMIQLNLQLQRLQEHFLAQQQQLAQTIQPPIEGSFDVFKSFLRYKPHSNFEEVMRLLNQRNVKAMIRINSNVSGVRNHFRANKKKINNNQTSIFIAKKQSSGSAQSSSKQIWQRGMLEGFSDLMNKQNLQGCRKSSFCVVDNSLPNYSSDASLEHQENKIPASQFKSSKRRDEGSVFSQQDKIIADNFDVLPSSNISYEINKSEQLKQLIGDNHQVQQSNSAVADEQEALVAVQIEELLGDEVDSSMQQLRITNSQIKGMHCLSFSSCIDNIISSSDLHHRCLTDSLTIRETSDSGLPTIKDFSVKRKHPRMQQKQETAM